jgi:hypothetical protein
MVDRKSRRAYPEKRKAARSVSFMTIAASGDDAWKAFGAGSARMLLAIETIPRSPTPSAM